MLFKPKRGCDTYKDGYSFDKGECFELPKPDQNNNCTQGFYLKDNNCKRICDGVDYILKIFIIFYWYKWMFSLH